ncbi:uncharacterized protein [Parasteatoda tepidariorum]|uniref:uncharacterized protein n=1 Tax=Parasteatoda tepidariorum TaxID=114398 RepID=UPI001C7194FF|nr:uncharacterized protein LOC107452792 [Parasteatoda tepidariorum]
MEISFPSSYTQNNEREIEVLKRADNFLRQFRFLYPARPEPPLYFENECKIRKLTCTTLCPTRITKTISLNEWKNSAQFLADYVEYKPAKFPQEIPYQLFSLDAILKKREGTSLEMCMLLCSFLLSSSYDAFVVQGYATQAVTEKLQKSTSNPLDHISEKFKHYRELYANKDIKPTGKYYLDFYSAKKYWMAGSYDVTKETTKIIPEKIDVTTSEKAIHFWVLLRSSENKNIFIEASSGESFLIDEPNYLGVEFLWNNKNFWYYRGEYKGSCKDINFDLTEIMEWEQFLPTYKIKSKRDGSQIRMPDTWIREMEITQEEFENRFSPDGKLIRYNMAEAIKHNSDSIKNGQVHKITYYKDSSYKVPEKILLFFEGRKDKLQHRLIDCNIMIAKDMFSKGRDDAMKEHEYCLKENPKFIQTIKFYSNMRSDNLLSKEWNNKFVKEIFVDRIDRLNLREIVYDDENVLEDKKMFNAGKQDLLDDSGKEKEAFEVKYHIGPSMFENFEILFEDIEFSELDMQTFLQIIDPAERYVSTDSDSEREEDNVTEIGRENISIVVDKNFKESSESFEKNTRNKINKDFPDDFVKEDIDDDSNFRTHQISLVNDITNELEDNASEQDTYSSDDIEIKHYASHKSTLEDDEIEVQQEGTLKVKSKKGSKDIEVFDDINFDDLSDEELQTNYKLYLFRLWEKFSNEANIDLLFMRDFSDSHEKNILDSKRKIIRKRRKNMRYQQRLEYGKPSIRVYKKKLDENLDKMPSHAVKLAENFRLAEKFPGCNFTCLEEFEFPMDALNEFGNHAKSEIIEKECLQIYDTGIKQIKEADKVKKEKRIVCFKKAFSLDPTVPDDHSINEVWYLPEICSFRIDFHYPEGKSGGRKLLLTKPVCKSTAFKFRDYLFREITPSYETSKISKSRLYCYLVSLLKEEPVFLKELESFEKDMEIPLAKREIEIRDLFGD